MASGAKTIDELREAYARIRQDVTNFLEWKAFVEELNCATDLEALGFHYDLLRDRSQELFYFMLRAGFSDRSEDSAAQFLIARSEDEDDPGMRADILVMLGLMRRPEALELARKAIADSDGEARYAACDVLGLVGKPPDIPRLREALLRDQFAPARSTAARAHLDLFDRFPRQMNVLLRNLRDALQMESDDDVAGRIVISTGDILKKRFGVKFDETEGEVVGDLLKARERCA